MYKMLFYEYSLVCLDKKDKDKIKINKKNKKMRQNQWK